MSGGVDQDPAIARRAHAVASRHYPDAQLPFLGETHRGHHVGRAIGYDHQRWTLMDGQVPRPARLLIAFLSQRVRRAAQAGPQSL